MSERRILIDELKSRYLSYVATSNENAQSAKLLKKTIDFLETKVKEDSDGSCEVIQ